MEVIKPKRFFVKGIKFKRKHYYRKKKISLQKMKKEITHKKRKKKHCPNPLRLIKTEDYVHHSDYNQTHTHAIIKKVNIKYSCLYCETKDEKNNPYRIFFLKMHRIFYGYYDKRWHLSCTNLYVRRKKEYKL